jgi:hypothetical protein
MRWWVTICLVVLCSIVILIPFDSEIILQQIEWKVDPNLLLVLDKDHFTRENDYFDCGWEFE